MNEDLLPDVIQVPKKYTTNWVYKKAVERCKNYYKEAREGIEGAVLEFYRAHEELVINKPKGKTWGGFCKEVGVSHDTPYRWFDRYGLEWTKVSKGGKKPIVNTIKDKPLKKQTKPKTKLQLEEVAKEIEEGNVSDDDIRTVSKATAKAIDKGIAAPRTGTQVATAVSKAQKKKREYKKEESKSNIRKLAKDLESCTTRLKYLLDEDEEYLVKTKDDKIYLQAIRNMGPGFIWHFHNLGIDTVRVYNLLIKPKEVTNGEEEKEETKWGDPIEVEYTEVT